MNIKEHIKKIGWNVEAESKKCRYMNVDVSFVNSEGRDDETQFSIKAYDADELSRLFADFCKENGFKKNSVTCVTIVQMTETMEELD